MPIIVSLISYLLVKCYCKTASLYYSSRNYNHQNPNKYFIHESFCSFSYTLHTTSEESWGSEAPVIETPFLFRCSKKSRTSSVITSPGIVTGIPGGKGHISSPHTSPTLLVMLCFPFLAKKASLGFMPILMSVKGAKMLSLLLCSIPRIGPKELTSSRPDTSL